MPRTFGSGIGPSRFNLESTASVTRNSTRRSMASGVVRTRADDIVAVPRPIVFVFWVWRRQNLLHDFLDGLGALQGQIFVVFLGAASGCCAPGSAGRDAGGGRALGNAGARARTGERRSLSAMNSVELTENRKRADVHIRQAEIDSGG